MSDDFAECGFALTAKLRAELYRVYNRLQEAHAERDAARADLAAANAARDEWRELAHRWELEAKNYRWLLKEARDNLSVGRRDDLFARIDAALVKDEDDGQPDEMTEWRDYDPDC